jgi:hypothetical protein
VLITEMTASFDQLAFQLMLVRASSCYVRMGSKELRIVEPG